MTETPSAALRQSSLERRSPVNTSTFFPTEHRLKTSLKWPKRLEGRTKQRRFVKPYSSRFSTTLAPIKPFDPVTRRQSLGSTKYLTSIGVSLRGMELSGNRSG